MTTPDVMVGDEVMTDVNVTSRRTISGVLILGRIGNRHAEVWLSPYVAEEIADMVGRPWPWEIDLYTQ